MLPVVPCAVPNSARMLTFESPSAFAMRATAPGWLSTEIVNCLVLAMPHLLWAAIIPPLLAAVAVRGLDLLALPTSSPEQKDSRCGDGTFGDHDGDVHAIRAQACGDRQKISQRNLQDPEPEEVNVGWCDRVARAVEGLQHHHAVGVADVPVAQDAQASGGPWHDHRIIGEQTNDRRGKEQKDYADEAEKQHVVSRCARRRFARAPAAWRPNSAQRA